jgi:C-terminal processing protease CtpA/Prc
LYKKNDKIIAKEYNYFITTDIPAKIKGNLLQLGFLSMYGKIFPDHLSNAEKEELNTWRENNNGLQFKKLTSKTAYLKIPTFQKNEDQIQQLVVQNDSIIRSCENLIVDITGNGGGSTGWVSLMPYFMTNPIVQYDTYLRVTPENINFKLADLEPFAVNPIPEAYKKYFPDEIITAYKKAYNELPTTKDEFYPIPGVTFPLDSIFKKPSKIALVVDDFCGSSAEYFFYLSKQSKKTKTYGINTIGMMDYEGMSNLTPMPYANYYLTIPIVKSSWTDKNPIDKNGFKPDITLEKVEQNKWVDFIKKDMERP